MTTRPSTPASCACVCASEPWGGPARLAAAEPVRPEGQALAPNAEPDPPETLAIPRGPDGEPLFAEPWEARAFAMVVGLHGRGLFDWSAFQALLIEEIGRSEAAGEPRPYYLNWLMAAERLVESLGLAQRTEVDAVVAHLRPEDRTVRLR